MMAARAVTDPTRPARPVDEAEALGLSADLGGQVPKQAAHTQCSYCRPDCNNRGDDEPMTERMHAAQPCEAHVVLAR
jgi:hypothetical protein